MKLVAKLGSLFLGFSLYAIGILLTIHAGLGVSPWDAFHLGIVNHFPLTLGQTSQLVGLVIILLCIILREIPGWGSIGNMYFIGLFIDIIEGRQLIRTPDGLGMQVIMLFSGIFIIGWATYFYLSAGLGSGPRDGLMLALSRIMKTRVVIPRTIIEATVLVFGYFMGAPIGVGTVLTALLVGHSVQFAYRVAGNDPRDTIHWTLIDEYRRGRRQLGL